MSTYRMDPCQHACPHVQFNAVQRIAAKIVPEHCLIRLLYVVPLQLSYNMSVDIRQLVHAVCFASGGPDYIRDQKRLTELFKEPGELWPSRTIG